MTRNKTKNQLFFDCLETGVVKWPDGSLDDYSTYGHKHMLCPFCDEANNLENPFHVLEEYYIDNDGKQKEAIKDQMLFLCDQHEYIYKQFKNQQGRKVANKSDISNPRIRHYLQTEALPPDIAQYAVGNEKHHLCCFCQQPHGTNFLTMPIEQGSHDIILGWAAICINCEHVISKHEKLYTNLNPSVTSTVCVKCGDPYAITRKEYDTRVINKTIGKHHCDACLENWYGLIGRDRFVKIQCEECSNSTWIDRTLYPEVTTYLCNNHDEENAYSYLLGDNDELLLEIYREIQHKTEYWHYNILVASTGEYLESSSKDNPIGYKDIMQCTIEGTLKTSEILDIKYNQQIKLFE